MPPVAPMLAKSVKDLPHGPLQLRAQVGRLPLHHLPRRRRGRAGQPQRAADDPLLPRGGRGGHARSCRSGAWSTARSSSPAGPGEPARLRARCTSGSTRRTPGSSCSPRRPRPRSSRSTCSRSDDESLTGPAVRRAAGRGSSRRWPRSRPPVHVTPATTDPAAARAWFTQFEGAGLDGVVAKPLDVAVRAGQAGDVQGQARAHRRRGGGRLPLHKSRPGGIGSLLLGLYDDDGRAAATSG